MSQQRTEYRFVRVIIQMEYDIIITMILVACVCSFFCILSMNHLLYSMVSLASLVPISSHYYINNSPLSFTVRHDFTEIVAYITSRDAHPQLRTFSVK